MSGTLRIIGLGPGPARWITPEVTAALAAATDVVGYRSYLARLALAPVQRVHDSDNGEELARAELALRLAAEGNDVVVVSGGDPGVFAMAAAVIEAIDRGSPELRGLDVSVLPGVTAMLAAAARLGAPLGNDFCAINLSDNLKPFSVIERRLRLASQADFALALYNPASRARPEQVRRAFEILREERAAQTLVAFASAIGRPDEDVHVTTLGAADPGRADMRTLVIVGASTTRCVARPEGTPFVYTPRWVPEEDA